LGPFHVSGASERELWDNICLDEGMPIVASGRMTDTGGSPIEVATLDVWMANEDGFYDVQQPRIKPRMNLRGIFHADADGRYWFRSARHRIVLFHFFNR
jgi:protocatechuate 3,4-dioxygenase beta subunit